MLFVWYYESIRQFCIETIHESRKRKKKFCSLGVCFLKYHFIGLPVVRMVSGVISMKSIDMYIPHDSSLVVCFSNISTYFA